MTVEKILLITFGICCLGLLGFPTNDTSAQGVSDVDFDSLPSVAVCEDGRQIVGYGVIIDDLTVAATIRLTLVSGPDFDPAFALVNPNGSIECSNNSPQAAGTTVLVPGLGRVESNDFSTQRTVTVPNTGEIRLVVGGFPGQSGQFALIIEDLRIQREDEIDQIIVKVPPSATGEWTNMFMIGETDALDPEMDLFVDDSVRPLVNCDNAATNTCIGVPTLVDRGAILDEGARLYQGDAFDAGIMGAFQSERLTYELSDLTGTNTGSYAAIFSALAPGAVIDSSFICQNVVLDVSDASPSYNASYETEFAIDGDASTFWVTGAGAISPETGTRQPVSFIAIGVDDSRPINKIRINGFAQSSNDFAPNALSNFAVQFPNANGELVTAVQGTLLQQPGFQSFSFPPALISELGFIMNDNYGGTLFTVVDIQVCAVP